MARTLAIALIDTTIGTFIAAVPVRCLCGAERAKQVPHSRSDAMNEQQSGKVGNIKMIE